MPVKVLTSETQSAPPSSAARALAAMLSAFGESLTIKGVFFRAVFAVFVTSFTLSGRIPNAIPPERTFGQEIFSSMISASPSKRAQIAA